MRHTKHIYIITALIFFIGLSAGITAGYGLAANIPMMIPYSGTIAAQGVPFNGNGQFKFAIINGHTDCQSSPSGSGCIAYWSNDLTSTSGNEPSSFVTLAVSGGSFGIKLGDTGLTNMIAIPGTVFDNGETYLRVWFRDTGTGAGFEILTPDRQLVSVPYAFRADVANTVTGTAAVGTEQIADGAVTGDKIAPGAIAVNAGTGLTGGGTSGDMTLNVNLAGTGTATTVARSDHDHDAAYVNATGDTMTGGLGLPLNGLAVGTNQFVTSGGNVGIGTAAPSEQLEITGNLRLPSTTATTGIIKSGANTLIHGYGTGNFFAGINAGNLAMTGGSNTASGTYSLYSNTTGNSNTANGASSLRSNTIGGGNTASGTLSLYSNTEGNSNTASGTYSLYSNTEGNSNTASGASSLRSNTTGGGNTASGALSLYSNTTGNDNTASGALSLFSNTTGNSNMASGAYSLLTNTTGSSNTASGKYSLFFNTEGNSNTANGASSLYFNTTGNYNTASGALSLSSNSTGSNNTSSGASSLYSNTTGYDNTASGAYSLYSNTEGYNNTATGISSLYFNTTGYANTASGTFSLYSNTEGFTNTASGFSSLYSNTTGSYNTADGDSSLYSNKTGYSNTAIGSYSLFYNTEGYNNTVTGRFSLYFNTTGYSNTASGVLSLYSNSTGVSNTATGISSLFTNQTGNFNTAFGTFSGDSNTTGSFNTFIGSDADASAGSLINATAIGSGAVVDASNKVRIGNDNVTVIGGAVAWSNLSDIRTKKEIRDIGLGLDFITSLRPVEFRMREGDNKINLGFVAQEIEALLGDDYSVLGIGEDEDHILSLRYTDFIAPLVKAVQEQQTEIADLKARLTDQQNQIELLQKQFRE